MTNQDLPMDTDEKIERLRVASRNLYARVAALSSKAVSGAAPKRSTDVGRVSTGKRNV